MWDKTHVITSAKENQIITATFNGDAIVEKITLNCGCTSATVVNGSTVVLKINTGKIAYGDSKTNETSADVATLDGKTANLKVTINVYRARHTASPSG